MLHTLRPVPHACVPVASPQPRRLRLPPPRSAWVHAVRWKHRTASALAQGWRVEQYPDVLRRGTTTAAGQHRGRATPLRLSHRTLSCICPPRLDGVSQGGRPKRLGRVCGLTAARMCLHVGRTVTPVVTLLTCISSHARWRWGKAHLAPTGAGPPRHRSPELGPVSHRSAHTSDRSAERGLCRHPTAGSSIPSRCCSGARLGGPLTPTRAPLWEGRRGLRGTIGMKIALFHEYKSGDVHRSRMAPCMPRPLRIERCMQIFLKESGNSSVMKSKRRKTYG
jgi:hypothetical protein